MKQFASEASFREAEFLIRQQVVYLEKSIAEKKSNCWKCYLAFLHCNRWLSQISEATYSGAVLTGEMVPLCDKLARDFGQTGGSLEVRLFDLNLLSLLFSGCEEQDARAFCDAIGAPYRVIFCGTFSYEWIGLALYEQVYRAFYPAGMLEERPIMASLSYQQNYLVDVVSRDRGEPRECLLVEAVDQVLHAYHEVVSSE